MIDITISCYGEAAKEIIDKAISAINECAGEKLEWKINSSSSGANASTVCASRISEVENYFDTLIIDFPQLNISAYYSYSCREGDSSANWW